MTAGGGSRYFEISMPVQGQEVGLGLEHTVCATATLRGTDDILCFSFGLIVGGIHCRNEATYEWLIHA